MLFLKNYIDIQQVLGFNTVLKNIVQSFLTILKRRFLGHFVYIYLLPLKGIHQTLLSKNLNLFS